MIQMRLLQRRQIFHDILQILVRTECQKDFQVPKPIMTDTDNFTSTIDIKKILHQFQDEGQVPEPRAPQAQGTAGSVQLDHLPEVQPILPGRKYPQGPRLRLRRQRPDGEV